MYKRFDKNTEIKANINLVKEAGYVLLLVMFFVGILLGSISLKNVSEDSIEANKEIIQNSVLLENKEQKDNYFKSSFFGGVRTIIFFWVIGLSIFGMPVLVVYVGYKGYSLGYTISAIVKILGTVARE